MTTLFADPQPHVYVPGVGGWCIRCGNQRKHPSHVPPPPSFFDLAKELSSDV